MALEIISGMSMIRPCSMRFPPGRLGSAGREVLARSSVCEKCPAAISPDDLIRPREQRLRNRQPERLCGLEVDDQLELPRLLDGQVSGLGALENLVDVGDGVPEHVETVRPIGQKATHLRVLAQPIDRWQTVPGREVFDSCSVVLEHGVYENDDRAGLLAGHRGEGAVDLAGTFRPQELK